MNWENESQTWPSVSLAEVPSVLVHALERNSDDARLNKIRLRWCPRGSETRKGFVTKDRLVNIEGRSCEELAVAVTSYAKHLYRTERCENRFEAQVERVQDDEEQTRQWRSLTFYLLDTDEAQDVDDDEFSVDDEFFCAPPSAPRIPARVAPAPPSQVARSTGPAFNVKDYEEFVKLSRSDPTAFAMMVVQQSHDQTVGILRDLLYASTYRVDSILSTQVSGSRYLNEALNTITRGAGSIAGLGVSLFESGLESRARVAEEERETVLGRERNEIARDAIKQGSLLMQTILMANAAKRNQEEQERARSQGTTRASHTTRGPAPALDPAAREKPVRTKTALEFDIEAKTLHFLELLEHEPVDELRAVAPTLSAFFDRLGQSALDGGRILALIKDAEQSVEREELMKVHTLVSAELASAFANLMMRAMSEQS